MKKLTHAIEADRGDDLRWLAVITRDKAADGEFVYAVHSTGVYCRPGCPARTAKRANVCFYSTPVEAEQAGFRPCKRCQPDAVSPQRRDADRITAACRYLEQAEDTPSLHAIAQYVGMSAYHFHRLFKAAVGLTPKAYALAQRAHKVRTQLTKRGSVTEAVFAAGYTSNSRFYEQSNALLGMPPTRYRAGGKGATLYFAVGLCSFGHILVAQSERGVCAIFLGDDPDQLVQALRTTFPHAQLVGGDPVFAQVMATVVQLVESPRTRWELPLDIRGTAFQQRVWQALCGIPPGTRVSYTELAERLGIPKAVRAVANACAANVLAVAIPCHRVVRNNGELAGYRWGIERKRALLAREQDE